MNLTSPKELKFILEKHGFSFTKSLGQNFLIDQNIVDKIIKEGSIEGENILEIGPGIGTMTHSMAKLAKKVVAIEIDEKLKPILKETVGNFDNTEVIFSDVLKTDIKKLAGEKFGGEPFKVVANLPYYITSPILVYLLKSKANISEIIVMMQREVADRIASSVGNKEYGSISVFIKYFGDSKIIMNVPNTVFMPKPKIGSAVIKITLNKEDRRISIEALEKVLRAAFQQRRKTVVNSLASGLGIEKDEVRNALKKLGISETFRAENLSLNDFLEVAEKLVSELEV